MLTVRNLHVRYEAVVAVDGLSLDVAGQEAVALLGPNGAGKSSTLRAISRLEPFEGSVSFDGEELHRLRAEHVAQRGLIHVPEGRRLFPNLTAEENIRVGATATGRRASTRTVDEVFDLFPALQPLAKRSAWQLSGGEQQMVAIGRALMASPRLLLLDEPTLGLAPVVVAILRDALRAVLETVPILMVEQNTSLALELCSRAYVMVGGQVVLEGTSDDLRGNDQLLDSILSRTSAH